MARLAVKGCRPRPASPVPRPLLLRRLRLRLVRLWLRLLRLRLHRRLFRWGLGLRRLREAGGHGLEVLVGFGEGGGKPAPIGYGAIVPKSSECENLFVTFALSSSHAAFGSIRMEPVFMVTSQSAATAACLAIADGVAVQEVDYAKLNERLEADHQVLQWPPRSTQKPVPPPSNPDTKPTTKPEIK